VLARELSKKFEEFRRGRAPNLLAAGREHGCAGVCSARRSPGNGSGAGPVRRIGQRQMAPNCRCRLTSGAALARGARLLPGHPAGHRDLARQESRPSRIIVAGHGRQANGTSMNLRCRTAPTGESLG
jgi:hypothetical protein